MLTGLLASVAVPILVDFLKTSAPTVTRKLFGVSVDEQIKIENATISRLEALAKLDAPSGTPSQWVIDLRASFRYLAAAGLILGGLVVVYMGVVAAAPEILGVGIEMATSPFGFIFGERLVLSYKPSGTNGHK